MNESAPVLSWNLKIYITDDKENRNSNSNKKDEDPDSSIINIKWCPQKPSGFFVFDSKGYCYYFDLLEKIFDPLYIQYSINNDNNNNNEKFGKTFLPDVSRCRPGSKSVYIATNVVLKNTQNVQKDNKSNNKNYNINVTIRMLSEDLLQKNVLGINDLDIACENDENKFRNSMSLWTSRLIKPQITVLIKKLSNESEMKDNRK